jgi:hypothetical protein
MEAEHVRSVQGIMKYENIFSYTKQTWNSHAIYSLLGHSQTADK